MYLFFTFSVYISDLGVWSCDDQVNYSTYPMTTKLTDNDLDSSYIIAAGDSSVLAILPMNKILRKPVVKVISNITCSPALGVTVMVFSTCTGGSTCQRNVCYPQVATPVSHMDKEFYKCTYLCENPDETMHISHIMIMFSFNPIRVCEINLE